jgi:glycogen synthase
MKTCHVAGIDAIYNCCYSELPLAPRWAGLAEFRDMARQDMAQQDMA